MKERFLEVPEDRSLDLRSELRRLFPKLEFRRFEWVGDPNIHLAIDDLTFREDSELIKNAAKNLEDCCQGQLRIYPITSITEGMVELTTGLLRTCDPESTLIIFPGEGAISVRDNLPQRMIVDFRSVVVEARRIRNREKGTIEGIEMPGVKRNLDIATNKMSLKTVLVIDDVIDTGSTINELRKEAAYPNTKWYAATPIMFSPLSYNGRINFLSSVEGYEKIFASLIVQGKENPVPLNSLSSFVEGSEKTQRLVGKCLDYYVKPEERALFVNSLLQLRCALR